ncbi:MAG: transglutaminase-like domain-containing protein [Acidobacteriota bacterium]
MDANGIEGCLRPTPGVDCDEPEIKALAARVTDGARDAGEAAVRLFAFVRDGIRYIPFAPFLAIEDYHGRAALERGYGFCTQKSSLLVGLCRAAGIPARFRYADLVNHNLPGRLGWVLGSDRMIYHTYVEIFLDGRWLKATPSFEKSLCEKMGWRLVEFDGTKDAVLHALDLSGRPHIEYVQDRGALPHIPLADMLATWLREYGPATLDRWRAATAGLADENAPPARP